MMTTARKMPRFLLPLFQTATSPFLSYSLQGPQSIRLSPRRSRICNRALILTADSECWHEVHKLWLSAEPTFKRSQGRRHKQYTAVGPRTSWPEPCYLVHQCVGRKPSASSRPSVVASLPQTLLPSSWYQREAGSNQMSTHFGSLSEVSPVFRCHWTDDSEERSCNWSHTMCAGQVEERSCLPRFINLALKYIMRAPQDSLFSAGAAGAAVPDFGARYSQGLKETTLNVPMKRPAAAADLSQESKPPSDKAIPHPSRKSSFASGFNADYSQTTESAFEGRAGTPQKAALICRRLRQLSV